jgi:hypothetical protein
MTASNDCAIVRLGALGWSHPEWSEAFYPPDMPEEWRLTFFNTQYHCTFLEQAIWRQAGREQWRQWHADTHAAFRFLLEGDAYQPLPAELRDKAVMLRPDDASLLWFTRDSSLKEIAAYLSGSSGIKPRYVISRDGDLSQMERVATLLEVMGLAG